MKKKLSIIFILSVLIISIIFLTNKNTNTQTHKSNSKIKYVFLFIGDGMSLPQIDITENYNNRVKGNPIDSQEKLSFTKFNTIGLRKNYSGDNYVTDSAASASELASGKLIQNEHLNIDINGNKVIPITYDLKNRRNMKIGIITNQSIDHATPAGFYAYSNDRQEYTNITNQIPNTNFDFLAGSTIRGYNKDFENNYKANGYTYLSNKEEYKNINSNGKYILVAPNNYIPYGMEQTNNDVSISDYLEMSLKVLNNDNGFFVMVESGMIDSAAHNNDAKAVISDVNELDKAVSIAYAFALTHPDETLIIVTGDHETGSTSLGSYEASYENLSNINMSISALEYLLNNSNMNVVEQLTLIKKNFNLNENSLRYKDIVNALNSSNYEQVINLIKLHEQDISGIHFNSNNHTGLSVPVYVYGDKDNIFTGEYTTDEFNKRLRKILN